MPRNKVQDSGELLEVLTAARAGSAEALGRLLMGCRDYLLMVANRNLEPDLQGKVSPSDLVQETFLEAQRDFAQFHGTREEEILAWLSRILLNNLANVSRRYRGTAMRALDREISLGAGDPAKTPGGDLALDTPSPSEVAMAKEDASALETALATLPEHYRTVLNLRYQDRLNFEQIGAALGCSAEAARKLWARAVDRLQKTLKGPHES
jgi:RNA polymerase sigma-70 factor (ECF subfamily)